MKLEGRRIPDVTFMIRRGATSPPVTSRELFDGRTVVAFALPGAFTPTCSSAHLPRFVDLAPMFRAHGVDDILCIAVNDPFVMEAWAAEQHADGVTFVPDGNGAFTRALGMMVDQSAKGLGQRSRRYAFIARDGTIERAFVEPEEGGDPVFGVGCRHGARGASRREARVPADVVLFTRAGCRFCMRAPTPARGARHSVRGRAREPARPARGCRAGRARRRSSWTARRSAVATISNAGSRRTATAATRRGGTSRPAPVAEQPA